MRFLLRLTLPAAIAVLFLAAGRVTAEEVSVPEDKAPGASTADRQTPQDQEPAQEEIGNEDRLTLPFTPEIGGRTHYSIVKTKQRTDGERLERDLKTTSDAELTLLSRNDQGYIYRFVISETEASAPGSSKPRLDRLLSRLAGVTTNIPLIYQADETGAPLHLINTQEVRQAFRGMLVELQAMVRQLNREGVISKVERPGLEASVKGTLGALASLSDEELGAVVLEEVGLLFTATGGDFLVGARESFEGQTTVPLVRRPIRISGQRLIKSVDRDTQIAVVEIESAFDRKELQAAVAQVTSRLTGADQPENGDVSPEETENGAAPEPSQGPSIRALGKFEVRERSLHMIDLRSGEPLGLRHQRTLAFGDKTVVEVTKIRRVRR